MRRGTLLLVCLGILYPAISSDFNPYDDELITYFVSEEEERQYRVKDEVMCSFWTAWENGARDYIHLTPDSSAKKEKEGFSVFSGPDDAQLIIYAAGGMKGLYLLMKVIDDSIVEPDFSKAMIDGSIGLDATDFYLNSKPSSEIKPEDNVKKWAYTMGNTCAQFQAWMKYTNGCRLTYYENDWSTSLVRKGQNKTHDCLTIDYIMAGDTVMQEWFIPWSRVGSSGGLQGNVPEANQRLGFAGGYNDIDSLDSAWTGKKWIWNGLRWKNHCDPWCKDTDAWGDLVMSSDFPGGEAMDPCVRVNTKRVSLYPPKQYLNNRVMKTEYFTVHGKKILPITPGQTNAPSILIEKKILANGTTEFRKLVRERIENRE